MMQYLVRLVQVHETFRKPELQALATIAGVNLDILYYDDGSPFCIVQLASDEEAKAFISRAILSYGIYELWGTASNYADLHSAVRTNDRVDIQRYRTVSFRFEVDSFRSKRSPAQQRDLIESFSYIDLQGPIKMVDPEMTMCVFELFEKGASEPTEVHLGRWLGGGARDAKVIFDLKKRKYISRTSMDAELSLVTANLTLAAPGKVIYDPFVGTGSFSVTAAHFGAVALGSDIDGRSMRGTSDVNLLSNFAQYGVTAGFLDSFVADLTHTPLRHIQWLDGIICDPPYGVREGPKVLGYREGKDAVPILIDGVPAHT